MRERPILFSAPEVRAILSGTKTQTRRLVGLDTLQVSKTPGYDLTWRGRAPLRSIAQQRRHPGCWQDVSTSRFLELCPYGVPGDRLWAREAWRTAAELDKKSPKAIGGAALEANYERPWAPLVYEADSERRDWAFGVPGKLRPGIHMPRWASRITLEVTEVRVQRLQQITDADAIAEGMPHPTEWSLDCSSTPPTRHFKRCWASVHGKRATWSASPWVWAISFRRVV